MIGSGSWKDAYNLPSTMRFATVREESIKKGRVGFILSGMAHNVKSHGHFAHR